MTSSHISSLNLVTVISSICNVSRQRPEHFPQVLSALESLHVNLPPTLGTVGETPPNLPMTKLRCEQCSSRFRAK
jgi:hypothetical protein